MRRLGFFAFWLLCASASYGQTLIDFDICRENTAAPPTPPADQAFIYCLDNGTFTSLWFKDSTGTAHDLGATLAPTGAEYVTTQDSAALGSDVFPSADDQVISSDSASSGTWKTLPNRAVAYFTASNTFAQAGIPDLAASTSAELRGVLSDDIGTGSAMFGLISTMADDLGCGGSQVVRRDAGDTAFECATLAGGGAPTTAEYVTTQDDAGLSADVFPSGANQVPVSSGVGAGSWTTVPDAALTSNYSGVGTCTNQFARVLNDNAAPTCATVVAADVDEASLEGILDLPDLQGILTAAKGGTGDDTSAVTGVPEIVAGNWTYAANIADLGSSTSAELRGVLSDETGTGNAMFGLSTDMTDNLTCSGDQVVKRNAGDTAFECGTVAGGSGLTHPQVMVRAAVGGAY